MDISIEKKIHKCKFINKGNQHTLKGIQSDLKSTNMYSAHLALNKNQNEEGIIEYS
jgi:hypothetical protein